MYVIKIIQYGCRRRWYRWLSLPVSATTVRIEQILQTTSRYYVICVNNTAIKFVWQVQLQSRCLWEIHGNFSKVSDWSTFCDILTSHDPVTENPPNIFFTLSNFTYTIHYRWGWPQNVLRTLQTFMLLSWWCPSGAEKQQLPASQFIRMYR